MIIDKITIKNKKGEILELTKEEYEELKLELNPVVYVGPQPYFVPYQNLRDYNETGTGRTPMWQTPPVIC